MNREESPSDDSWDERKRQERWREEDEQNERIGEGEFPRIVAVERDC